MSVPESELTSATLPQPVLGGAERASRSIAARLAIAALLAVFGLKAAQAFLFYRATTWIWGIDLNGYLVGARIALNNGWSHIYDLGLQRPQIIGYFVTGNSTFWNPFASPPETALLASPFTLVPQTVATTLWISLLIAALVATTIALAPPTKWWRLFFVSLLLTSTAVGGGLASGNTVALVVAAIIVTWRLLATDHEIAAGIVLGLACLKPQLVVLVPFAMLIGGRRKFFLAFVATVLSVAGLSLIAIGPTGLSQYLAVLKWLSTFSWVHFWTTDGALRPGVLATLVRIVVVVVVGLTALGYKRKRPGASIASALIGSLLVSNYLVTPDLTMAIVACLFIIREDAGPVVLLLSIVLIIETSMGNEELIFALELCLLTYLLAKAYVAKLPPQLRPWLRAEPAV